MSPTRTPKRFWALIMSCVLLVVSYHDVLLELFHEIQRDGLTWGILIPLYVLLYKKWRNRRFYERDQRFDDKLDAIMKAVGADWDPYNGQPSGLKRMARKGSKMRFFLLRTGTIPENQSRRMKKKMKEYLKKLGRTKLQVYIVFTIVNLYILAATWTGATNISESLQPYMPGINLFAQLVAGWVYSHYQGRVDVEAQKQNVYLLNPDQQSQVPTAPDPDKFIQGDGR